MIQSYFVPSCLSLLAVLERSISESNCLILVTHDFASAGLQEGQDKCEYKIEVQTSDVRGAGTDSNVEVRAKLLTHIVSMTETTQL